MIDPKLKKKTEDHNEFSLDNLLLRKQLFKIHQSIHTFPIHTLDYIPSRLLNMIAQLHSTLKIF